MNYFGKNITLQLYANEFEIGVVLSGVKANNVINFKLINEQLNRIKENIDYHIISGIKNNITNNYPITIIVKNTSKNLIEKGIIRPNYSDLLIIEKTNGHFLENFDSIETLYPITIAGLICKQILENSHNIKLISHINSVNDCYDKSFKNKNINVEEYDYLTSDEFPVIDPRAKSHFLQLIKKAKKDKKILTGTIETIIYNCPKYLGNPYFNSFESTISHFLHSIPFLKGIIFGNVDELLAKGNETLVDEYYFDENNIKTLNNYCNGTNSGITNGDLITVKTYFLPPIPLSNGIKTINIKNANEEIIKSNKPSEPLIIHHLIPIIEGIICIGILELLN